VLDARCGNVPDARCENVRDARCENVPEKLFGDGMRRYLVIFAMAALVVAAGCKDSAGPDGDGPYAAAITDINVPSQIALGDTVRLSFSYFTPGCDSSTVQIQQGDTQLRFTAMGYRTDRICVSDLGGTHRFSYYVFPPHGGPLSITFTEPTGGDSVRTVTPSP
jgi:hypothetical protein